MDMLNTQTISITNEILALISTIDEFKGAWRTSGGGLRKSHGFNFFVG
ncbi:MAG: hypothetical protein QM533_01785 [Cytophagales bacterium]|nr:hypothetical protein [Cytophagales bacterium]